LLIIIKIVYIRIVHEILNNAKTHNMMVDLVQNVEQLVEIFSVVVNSGCLTIAERNHGEDDGGRGRQHTNLKRSINNVSIN